MSILHIGRQFAGSQAAHTEADVASWATGGMCVCVRCVAELGADQHGEGAEADGVVHKTRRASAPQSPLCRGYQSTATTCCSFSVRAEPPRRTADEVRVFQLPREGLKGLRPAHEKGVAVRPALRWIVAGFADTCTLPIRDPYAIHTLPCRPSSYLGVVSTTISRLI